MGKYILKRCGYIVVVFLILSFLMYSLYNLIPTDPARQELEPQRKALKADEYQVLYQQLRKQMGLDDPLPVRYLRWMGLWAKPNGEVSGMVEGNFGYSNLYKRNVVEVIKTSFLPSLPWASPFRWAFTAPCIRASASTA